MPSINESLDQSKKLAEAPTMGNLHPDARAQAIARAGIADGQRAADQLKWLHSSNAVDTEGYEWGIYRVKWVDGKAADVQRTRADHADLDAAITTRSKPAAPQAPAPQPATAAPAEMPELARYEIRKGVLIQGDEGRFVLFRDVQAAWLEQS